MSLSAVVTVVEERYILMWSRFGAVRDDRTGEYYFATSDMMGNYQERYLLDKFSTLRFPG